MNIKTAFQTFTVVSMTALSLAACGSSTGPKPTTTTGTSTGTSTGTTTGTTTGTSGGGTTGSLPRDPSASTMATTSQVNASTAGGIPLPYVIYSPQTAATDSNKIYGIEFLDYDPCYQGSEYGYSSVPADQSFSQLGFYFPAAVAAGTYNVGTGAGDINASLGALGVKFSQKQDPNHATDPNVQVCTATTWLSITGGSVTVASVTGNNVSGSINLTLSDSSTVTGNFGSGSCSANGSGAVANPNGLRCDAEN